MSIYRQLLSLLTVRDKFSGVNTLSKRLAGGVFTIHGITRDEFREACLAIVHGDANRKVGEGKTARLIFWVSMTFSVLFARIPILEKYVQDVMMDIPDVSWDMILQKSLISNITKINEFKLAYAAGDFELARKRSVSVWANCLNMVEDHLGGAPLTKGYEADPYLSAAWITKESKKLHSPQIQEKMLKKSITLLNVLTGPRGQIKGPRNLAGQMLNGLMEDNANQKKHGL